MRRWESNKARNPKSEARKKSEIRFSRGDAEGEETEGFNRKERRDRREEEKIGLRAGWLCGGGGFCGRWGSGAILDDGVDEAEFAGNGVGEDEWVEVGKTHAAV